MIVVDARPQPSGQVEPTAVLDGIRRRIADLKLDLGGLNVITEAATGAYACTAVIAAMAGASSVTAVGKDTRHYGSYRDAVDARWRLLPRRASPIGYPLRRRSARTCWQHVTS